MGFSTIATQLLFFIAIVGLASVVLGVYSDYISQSMGAVSDKQGYITSQLRTDIRITNIDNSSGHLHVYAKNVGEEILGTDCVDLYVDGGYVAVIPSRKTDPSDGSTLTEWIPEQTLKMNPVSVALNDVVTHTAKVVTCNGVTDNENF